MERAFRLLAQAAMATAVLIAAAAVIPAAAQDVAPAPKVGDTWRFRETDLLTRNETRRYTDRLVAASPAEYWVEGASERSRWWWRYDTARATRLQMFEHTADAPEQRGKLIGSADGGFAKRWPLKVGDSWDCTEDTTWPNGWKVKYELKCSVEAMEPVETAGRPFRCLPDRRKGAPP